MYYFRQIEYLYGLAAIPVMLLLFFLPVQWKKKTGKKIGDPHLVKQLTQGFSQTLFSIKFILITLAFGLCVFAVAGLMKPKGSETINRSGIDIVIALDVSNNMLADD